MIKSVPIGDPNSNITSSRSLDNSNNSFTFLQKDYLNNELKNDSFRLNNDDLEERISLQNFSNVYDSFVDEEDDEEQIFKNDLNEESKYVFRKESLFKDCWTFLIFLLILYSVTVSPITIAYYETNNFLITKLNILVDCLFLVDLVFNFLTAYQDKEGNRVADLKLIAIKYLSSWFCMDLISSLPLDVIGLYYEYYQNNYGNLSDSSKIQSLLRISKLIRLGKWLKVFRFLKLAKGGETISRFFYVFEYNRLFIFAGVFLILIHISSCLWIYIGKLSNDSINWIYHHHFENYDSFSLYIASLYFTFYTVLTVGYGDITSINYWERIYNIFFMFFGVIIFSFCLSSLSNIFAKFDQSSIIFQRRNLILNELKREYNIPHTLISKIRKTIKHELKKLNIERYEFIDSLPTAIKNDLSLVIYKNHINNLEFFKQQSREFILYTLPLLKPMALTQGEVLFSTGEYVNEMYLVIKGCLNLTMGSICNDLKLARIKQGFHIGDVMLYLHEKSPFDLKSSKNGTEILAIKKIDFFKIKMHFNEIVQNILNESMKKMEMYEKKRLLITTIRTYVNDKNEIPEKLRLININLLTNEFRNFFYSQDAQDTYEYVESLCEEELVKIMNIPKEKVKQVRGSLDSQKIKEKQQQLKNSKQSELLKSIVDDILQMNKLKHEIPTFKNSGNEIKKGIPIFDDIVSKRKHAITNETIFQNRKYSLTTGIDLNMIREEFQSNNDVEPESKNLDQPLLNKIKGKINKLKVIMKEARSNVARLSNCGMILDKKKASIDKSKQSKCFHPNELLISSDEENYLEKIKRRSIEKNNVTKNSQKLKIRKQEKVQFKKQSINLEEDNGGYAKNCKKLDQMYYFLTLIEQKYVNG